MCTQGTLVMSSEVQTGPKTLVKKTTFAIEREYLIASADGSRVLTASSRKSVRGSKDFKHILDSVTTFFLGSRGALLVCRAEGAGGFTLDFEPKEEALRRPFSTSFIFSGRAPNALRIHSREHCNNMCFFLGENEPREWVVWDMPTRPDGTWEVVALEWLDGDEGHFKINGGGQYVKWVVCGFASTRDPNEASVFTMLEA